jgi:hypothetical protein
MVAAQPQFGDGAELMVLGNLLRHEVAVIVDDGQRLGVLVIEVLRRGGVQQEIGSKKFFHISILYSLLIII